MRSLPLFHRVAGQPVIVLGQGEGAEAKRRLVERAGGEVVGEEHSGARLAFVALPEPEAAAARLKARGLLVNVTDRPELCDFTVPSMLERDPVLIAVGTSGVSAGLAKQLRLKLEALLPADLGRLAEALYAARAALRQRWPEANERRRALDAALAGPLDPFLDGSADRVVGWLGDPAAGGEAGTEEIRLVSDDPDALTLRQARLLGTADCVVFDPATAPEVLARARADAVRVALPAKAPPGAGLTVIVRRA